MDAVNNPDDDFDDLIALLDEGNESVNEVRVGVPQLLPLQQNATSRVNVQASLYCLYRVVPCS